ncbi:hypothetical protein GCM10027055_24000 [Janibacter alkaliphilus]|uniref:8-oxo-dGTP pyrophosphatase MutT (NUDIX family)/ribosomal protein S18 acetylase RimI-like enzyme n=1 Tax=Janibacter alkaliphilus TaxID=1069963 RepID=A0A852XCV5_9MICO|nr:GNAT family N-acetyltransferase [Janibacter alkaliphilus]NYG38294.1 8-oxo-dGTP pyrophosphatase MutT (NUDIX family)/ribosomal protein S18 acetylase RimI-like enzyme [Janibacter alkaliphilus]
MTSTVRVRPATHADAPLLAEIEAAADTLLAAHLDTSGWAPPTAGEERLGRDGGALLVAEDEGTVVGFAHLVDLDEGAWHLDALAVRPERQRQGIGTELLRAAEAAVLAGGVGAMTLMTFADVPFNAPWYARLGYTTVEPPPSFMHAVVRDEEAAGVAASGRRVAMVRSLVGAVTPRLAVSVIPLRDEGGQLQAYVQHRVAQMDFAAGRVVFPGGRVDPQDRAAVADARRPGADGLGADPAVPDPAWALTSLPATSDPAVEEAVLRAAGVRELAEETGLEVDPGALVPWDWWVTPVGSPKRFDTYFFVLPAAGLAPQNVTTEASHAGWESVAGLLSSAGSGQVRLMTPTRVILTELAALGSVDAVLAHRPVIADERRAPGEVRARR